MGILTNQLSLPEPIRAAIENDPYDKGDCEYTTTQLIRPVRINALYRRHGAEITEDVSDRIFALLGQSIHTILERANPEPEFDMEHDTERVIVNIKEPRYIVEKRYYMAVDGVRIGGQIDVYDKETHVLSDYKLCSLYVTKEGVKPEWEAQMNMNRLIMESNGILVLGMTIVAIFRDWSLMAADRKEDYPQRQVQVLDVPAWSEEKTIKFIRDRIKAHQDAEKHFPGPVCTEAERWTRPKKWALQKKGQKRAVKLFETKEQAEAAAQWDNGLLPNPKYYVEERRGEEVRCKYFCRVAPYCDFGRSVLSGEDDMFQQEKGNQL